MRILHFADLHIGVENYGRPDPATGLSTRLGDFLAALDQLVDHALANEIDLVLFCGDAYKSRDPSQTHQREFARRVARLTGAGIPVFLLTGNHDVPYAAGRANAVDIFPTLSVPLVHIGARLETQVVRTRRGEPLQVVAVPWINRSWLLAQEQHKNLPLGRPFNELMEERLHEALAVQFDALDPAVPAVLAGHLSLAEAMPGSEQRMTIGSDPIFLTSTFQGHGGKLEYFALGHIHRRQVREGQVPLVYPGSLQRVDFGEEGQEKGFYVLEIDPARPPGQRLVTYDFVPVEARAFITLEVRSRDGNPTEDVLRAIARREREIEDAVVRVSVNIGGASTPAGFDETAVRRALASAHYIAGVTRELEASPRGRLGGVRIEEMAPLRALEMYLASRNTSEERTALLLEHAGRLLVPEPET